MVTKILLILLILLFQLVHLWATLALFFAIITDSKRAWRIAVSYDQLANVLIGGYEDETISSRAQRARLLGVTWGCVLCKMLDSIWPKHCEQSLQAEIDLNKANRQKSTKSAFMRIFFNLILERQHHGSLADFINFNDCSRYVNCIFCKQK